MITIKRCAIHSTKCYICLSRFMSLKRSTVVITPESEKANDFPQPHYDLEYCCNPSNKSEIESNIKKRKSLANINRVLQFNYRLKELAKNSEEYTYVRNSFLKEVGKLPNKLHNCIRNLDDKPQFVSNIGLKREFNFKPKEFNEISKYLRIARSENLSNFTNHRSYFLMGQLAEMESALVKYSLKHMLSKNFQLISVPDILNKRVIESCGMATEGERNQVYSLDADVYGNDLCLSGTSEIAIAGYLMNKSFAKCDLPARFAAVSRCFRAETSRTSEERGIYRVHHFTKVEMFGVSLPEQSDELLDEFRNIEESYFESLGLYLQILDMAPSDLGNQASRKYDIEAWLPGRNMFGEVSSCSNCTDYQSRRLNIKADGNFAHTINGTACAIPRLLIAILETHQNKDGTVNIPNVLQPYMGGQTSIKINNNIPKIKSYKTFIR